MALPQGMHIDQHRERLRDRIAPLALLLSLDRLASCDYVVVSPMADAVADTVLRIDTIACLLERVAAVSAACTRRLSRVVAPGQASMAMQA